MSHLRKLLIAALMALWPAVASAQLDTATAIGTVVDAQGAALPGVTVTARNLETGFVRTGVTDGEGRYRVAVIPPGSYEFSAELASFATGIRKGVRLTVGAEAVINFELALANVSEQVTVTADSPIVETTTAAVQSTITREQIDLLPLGARDYTNVIRLVPGAAANNASYGFGGSRGRSNTWNVDGVDNSDEISGFAHQSPGLDSIKEVQVLVNGFKAEYGQASGGVINVITRAGTNDFHGSGFFTFRDESLTSHSPYANRQLPKDPFQRIQYGATAGGPIRKDRLHFFASYEREDRDTASASTRTLPSSSANFAASTRQFLATHNIPLSLFGDGGTVRQVRPEYVDIHKTTARIDNQVGANQFYTVRYLLDSNDSPSGQSGTLLDYNGGLNYLRTDYVNLNHKWILGTNKLNEAYVQFGRHKERIDAVYNTLPTITVTGGFTLGSGSNFNPVDNKVLALNDIFTWTKSGGRLGEHVLRTGAQIKILRSDSFFDSNFRGTFSFSSLNDFINGRPNRFTQRQGDSQLERPNETYGFFVQDDWRPRSDLTFNLGLRYDYETAKTLALIPVIGEPGPGISKDKDNVSPRFGFAWSPGSSTRQAFYGGTGIYYDQVILNIIGNARFTPPKIRDIQIDNPAWPDPFLGGTLTIPPPSLSIIDPDLVTPYNWNSQAGYRRELRPDLGIDVSFLYNRGYDHIGIVNTNAGIPGTASLTGTNAVRPDPNFVNKSFYTNFGEIRYKALLVDLRKRLSHGLQGGVAYTLSKTDNNAFNFVSTIQIPANPELSFGPDTQDRRHRIVGHVEYNLPWDVQLGAIVDYRSEAPIDVFAGGRDLNGDGITGDWVNETICRQAAVNCTGSRYSRNSVRELSLEEANRLRGLLGQPPIAAFANNPKYFNADVTLQKRIRFGSHAIRLTAEVFNLLNTPQRTLPDSNILSGTFGRYTAVEQPRFAQFTFQYDF